MLKRRLLRRFQRDEKRFTIFTFKNQTTHKLKESQNVVGSNSWGFRVYEFKVIDRAGRVIEVKVSAKSGAMIGVEGE